MQSKKEISAVFALITAMPKGKFFPFKNGTWQTYDGDTIRGNLYLNGFPALNYYITEPGKMHIFFGTDNPPRISYEEFVFNGSDSIWEITSVAKTYAIAPQIASYLDGLLQYIEDGGKLYVETE